MKLFSIKILLSTNPRKFSPGKVSSYTGEQEGEHQQLWEVESLELVSALTSGLQQCVYNHWAE